MFPKVGFKASVSAAAFSEDERIWMRSAEACPELKPGAGLISPWHLHVRSPLELSGQHCLRPSVPR